MAHPLESEARQAHASKLNVLTGKRGEYPPDRAARIAGKPEGTNAQGDAARDPEEVFVAAPARQVSNYGTVKGK